MPAGPFRASGLKENDTFVMLVQRGEQGDVESVRLVKVEDAAARKSGARLPKVLMRDGRRLTTRR